MADSLGERLKHAWNIFRDNKEPNLFENQVIYSGTNQARRPIGSKKHGKQIIQAIYTRIAMDVAQFDISHVRIDENDRYVETIYSGLNNCLTVEANKDQSGRSFIQDVAMSMFDEGCVAIVPVDTTISPKVSGSFEINTMRTGKILEWAPDNVRVEIYNDRTGQREMEWVPKNIVAIIENPLYSVMNEPNGTLSRLLRKLALLDAIDEQSSSGKLDLIIQLPYVIKSDARMKQADTRRKQIETQLSGSKYGIAYIDGLEKVTQLNRPAENNLMNQITYLTNLLYNQIGITEDVFTGKADERAMKNYYNRTVEPIVTAIVEELRRKFLTKTARTQGQTILAFHNGLKLITSSEMAEITDSLTRNEVLTSNEVRSILGLKPSSAPQADELRNKNMPIDQSAVVSQGVVDTSEYDKLVEDFIAGVEADMESIIGGS